MEVLSYAGQPTIALHDKDIDPCKGAGLETYTSPATGASELTLLYSFGRKLQSSQCWPRCPARLCPGSPILPFPCQPGVVEPTRT